MIVGVIVLVLKFSTEHKGVRGSMALEACNCIALSFKVSFLTVALLNPVDYANSM